MPALPLRNGNEYNNGESIAANTVPPSSGFFQAIYIGIGGSVLIRNDAGVVVMSFALVPAGTLLPARGASLDVGSTADAMIALW